MATAFIFPGQGSQSVGMGAQLAAASPAARAVFEEVDAALGQHLFRLMRDGPEAELTLTANAQPAIFALSMAVAAVLEREGGVRVAERGAFVAGHSLGEYSALCSVGALGLADTARLLRLRGEAMQAAVPAGEGAMAVILGLDLEAVSVLAAQAAEGQVCVAANDNGAGQIVISGHAAAVARACAAAPARGAKRAITLAVSAPFHSPLMRPAAEAMAAALATAAIARPFVPLVANVTAAATADPDAIRALLVEQMTALVRWRESLEAMAAAGVDHFVELGGRVTGPMARRVVPDARATSLVTMADIEAFV